AHRHAAAHGLAAPELGTLAQPQQRPLLVSLEFEHLRALQCDQCVRVRVVDAQQRQLAALFERCRSGIETCECVDHASNPSSTSLPTERPLSMRVWALRRFAALIGPMTSDSVLRTSPASTISETAFSASCCAIMSLVSNTERVNIESQCSEMLFALSGLISSGAVRSSISPILPCGASICGY